MKDTFYFSHDYNTRNDEKIRNLLYKHGFEGYGLYWALIEELYQNTNVLQTNYDRIAFELHSEYEIVKSVIQDFDLFVIDGDYFGSLSVQKRLDERAGKSQKARESVLFRWNDTNVIRPYAERTTIKERKGKERKGKESKVNTPEGVGASKNVFDFSFVEKSFAQPFALWLDYKKEKNQAYKSQKSIEACYDQLKKLSGGKPSEFEQIINQSLANNWAGLFALKTEKNGNTRNNTNAENRNSLAELAQRSGEFLSAVAGQDV